MGMLHFSDGVSFDTSGPLRVTYRGDGYYVVGKGMLIPVDSRKEGEDTIAEMEATNGNPNR
jgi:hypothetical protein